MRNIQSTLSYRWFDEVWNQDNENAIDQLMTHEAKANGIISEGQPGGAEGFKVFFRNFRTQFHDVKIDVEDVVAEDDMECARMTVNAVHTASGKPVKFAGICMAKIADQKIAEAWNNFDFLGMYQQLGQQLVQGDGAQKDNV